MPRPIVHPSETRIRFEIGFTRLHPGEEQDHAQRLATATVGVDHGRGAA